MPIFREYEDLGFTDIDQINQKIDTWDMAPPPCKGCAFAHRCAIHNLACIDFFHYVNLRDDEKLARVRTPSKKWYQRSYRLGRNDSHGETNTTVNNETSGGVAECNTFDGCPVGD